MIKKCFLNETKTIKVKDDDKFAFKVQMISIEAKMRKKMIICKNKRDYLINPSSLTKNNFSIKSSTRKLGQDDPSTAIGGGHYNGESCNFTSNLDKNADLKSIDILDLSNAEMGKGKIDFNTDQLKQNKKNQSLIEQKSNNFFITEVENGQKNFQKERPKTAMKAMSTTDLISRNKKVKRLDKSRHLHKSQAMLFQSTNYHISQTFKKAKYGKEIMERVSTGLQYQVHEGMITYMREAMDSKFQRQYELMLKKRDHLKKCSNQLKNER